MLCANGLEKKKVRLIYGAIDDDCLPVKGIVRDPRTILLASSFSKRKGVEILPEIVKNLADWNFLILGRGWDKFLNATSLLENQNVHFEYFNKVTRNIAMSRAGVFLSLSNLEGGPMPLIESMSFGVNPVATDTGFARDFIKNGINGFILPLNPTVDQVCSAIIATKDLTSSPTNEVSFLTWDRITKIVLDDFHKLKKSSTIKI
jgi:glycosyltransferase involved in cell wall biosynthesis